MFLIIAIILIASASASAYAYDMTRTNRSVVVHREFQPLTKKVPQVYVRSNNTGVKVQRSNSTPLQTVPASRRPAPAPLPRSLRH